jgi:hypothetical protein
MPTKDLKAILQEIQKLAKPIDLSGGGGGAAPAQTGHGPQAIQGGPAAGGGGNVNPTPAIKEMQKAMQDFAAKVTAYSADAKTKTIRDDRKNFNDFLTEQYLATSDVKGAEYSKDPTQTKQVDKQKQATDLAEMDYIVDGLKRIGGQRNELQADNVWDFRTNNALKNIYAFAYALINIEKDFGKAGARMFNEDSLKQMDENIPEDVNPSKLPGAEKAKKAAALTPLINSLGKFYEYYVKKIALNPQYRGYIEGTYDMFTVKPGGEDPGKLTPQEQERLGKEANTLKLQHVVLPSKSGDKPFDIAYSYLASPQNFNKLLATLGYTPNEVENPDIQKKVLDAVRNHVTALISGRY